MVFFIHGADTYRSREKLKGLISDFKAKHDPAGMNVDRLDGRSAEKGELSNAVRSQPFLGSGKRMVVAERFLANKTSEAEVTLELIAAVPEATVLVFWDDLASDAASKKKVMKDVAKSKDVSILPFDRLSGPSLAKWVRDEVTRQGAEIGFAAVERLTTYIGGDLWRMRSEIDKLVAWRGGAEIRAEDVDSLVTGSAEEDIFGIMDALSAKDTARASRMIRKQVESGLEEPYVIAMLQRQSRILIQVRSFMSQSPKTDREEIGKALGMHPFVAQKAMAAAHAFHPAVLMNLMNVLFEADRGVKTGKVSAGHAIERILAAAS